MQLARLAIFVTDFGEAKRFYGDVLGLPLVSENPERLVFAHPDCELVAFPCERTASTADYAEAARSVFVFEVPSVDAALRELRAKGVEFLHDVPARNAWGRYAALRDPFGNVHEIFEPAEAARPALPRAGAWLVAASLGFWLAWWLMPGVGVTDPAQVLALVGGSRPSVYLSVLFQLASAAAYAPGVAGLLGSRLARASRGVRLGGVLLLIGAMGSAADAVYHLVAYEMTAPGIETDAMRLVQQRLQGPDLALLLPFVAAFFAGHALLVLGLARRGYAPRAGRALLAAVPVVATAGALAASAGLVPARWVGLAALAAQSGSLAAAAVGLCRPSVR
jgi:catechol 2,3-dioxygenase-like lactoylglutathione lyase family enzyme